MVENNTNSPGGTPQPSESIKNEQTVCKISKNRYCYICGDIVPQDTEHTTGYRENTAMYICADCQEKFIDSPDIFSNDALYGYCSGCGIKFQTDDEYIFHEKCIKKLEIF